MAATQLRPQFKFERGSRRLSRSYASVTAALDDIEHHIEHLAETGFGGLRLVEVTGEDVEIVADTHDAFRALIRERLMGWTPTYELWADRNLIGEFESISDAVEGIRAIYPKGRVAIDALRDLRILEGRAQGSTTILVLGGDWLRVLLREGDQ